MHYLFLQSGDKYWACN